ncbi:MAG: hypothetical protein CMK23_06480 [Porticoccaceae bacterium]|jgi:hypothetical protein|nr:hypothetical protein [Porticoccaceae bacterium]|tara:strand:- start:10749 stop:11525 length:777 start_codon:yes stop_codon:yes gene_type:complete
MKTLDGITVCMTFPSKHWEAYGKHSIPSFDKYWPENIKLHVYVEGDLDIPIETSSRVNIHSFDQYITGWRDFAKRNKDKDIFDHTVSGDISKRQAVKFSKKVYMQLFHLHNPYSRYLIYLDADLSTLQKIPQELLDNLTKGDHYVAFPDRRIRNKFTETGMLVWDCAHEYHDEWCSLYDSVYREDKIFTFPESHDCYAFDYATFKLEKEGKIKTADLGYGVNSRHPLVAGPLGKYFDHMKGGRKFTGFSKERVAAHGR